MCADLHREYGIDADAPGYLARVSWRWFQGRIAGLSDASRFRRACADEPVQMTPEQQLAEARARGRR